MTNPIPENDLGLYIKMGKRYKQIDPTMRHLYDYGRPMNGVWVIKNESSTWIGENPNPERLRVQNLKKAIVSGLNKAEQLRRGGLSRSELADIILEEITAYYTKES